MALTAAVTPAGDRSAVEVNDDGRWWEAQKQTPCWDQCCFCMAAGTGPYGTSIFRYRTKNVDQPVKHTVNEEVVPL